MLAPISSPTHLVVFDFDWSLINENSDEYVVHALDPGGGIWAAAEKKLAEGMQWTALMDWVAQELHAAGHTAADMQAALARVPMLPSVLCAVSIARAAGADMRILSDANTLYIRWILEALGGSSSSLRAPHICVWVERPCVADPRSARGAFVQRAM